MYSWCTTACRLGDSAAMTLLTIRPDGSMTETPDAGADREATRDHQGPVAAIVLAAGMSTRMGRNKLLLELSGEPVVRRAVRRALSAGLSPVVVVTGHESARVAQAIGELATECRVIVNDDHARGVNSSLRAGIAALPASAVAAVVILADMPFVTSEMLTGLVSTYRASARGASTTALVISDYAGVNAPPMLFDRALFPELQRDEGEGCGRAVVARHRAAGMVLHWPAEALHDVDLPDDYERAARSEGS